MSRLMATLGVSRFDRGMEELDPDEQWIHVRAQIIERFIGQGVVPVPKLDLATKCDVLCVFKKQKKFFRKPVFEYIGKMEDLVLKYINWDDGLTKPVKRFNDRDLLPRYHRDMIVETQPEIEFEIQFNGAFHVGVKDRYLEGSRVVIDRKFPTLLKTKYLYVVTDVVYAPNLYFKVSSEFTMISDIAITKKTPIAFKYKKYKIKKDGNLVEVSTQIRWRFKSAGWSFPFKTTNISIANALHTSMRQLFY